MLTEFILEKKHIGLYLYAMQCDISEHLISLNYLVEHDYILRIGSCSNGCLEFNYWVRASLECGSKMTQLSGRGRKLASHINRG